MTAETAETATASGDPDLQLLRKTAEGDDSAFEELVRRHQDRLLAVCRRMLGDREEARDAVQEVFLRAYRKAATFRPRAQVSTWLYRIAVNHCLNRLRRRKVVRFLSLGSIGGADERGDAPAFDPEDPAAGPEEALAIRRRWAATRRALDGLPEGQRAVLVLAKFEGLSYREIAEVLGITVGAVESRLFRAMRRLERELGEEAGA